MKKFMFETSLGVVKCTVDLSKPHLSSDPDWPNFVLSEGEVKIISGEEYLDKLYTMGRLGGLRLQKSWVKIDLDDGYYGCPEYKIIKLPLL